jgi:hypothetical protein
MRTPLLILLSLFLIMVFPAEGEAELTAHQIIALARQQLIVPSEFTLGEMKVYRGERLSRFYSFVLGKLWDEETQTEHVRLDFKTPMDANLDTDRRYLLRRAAKTPPAQWLYLPALRRVRIVPYQPDDPVLQSDYLFYDLTPIHSFDDYRYRFVNPEKNAPVIVGEPQSPFVPYQEAALYLERRGETYIVTRVKYTLRDEEREARFSEFSEIAPRHFRPHRLVVTSGGGRTELVFSHWVFSFPQPQFFTPTHLETATLTLPEKQEQE